MTAEGDLKQKNTLAVRGKGIGNYQIVSKQCLAALITTTEWLSHPM
ncbi:hypothetical protein PPRY_b1056 [Pseudoalteromonas prydzensis ACAM 620]|nr:hypothetical protein [Pseudoalteromonas prydzensis ACAM 620]